jgi:hypothetical protein
VEVLTDVIAGDWICMSAQRCEEKNGVGIFDVSEDILKVKYRYINNSGLFSLSLTEIYQ